MKANTAEEALAKLNGGKRPTQAGSRAAMEARLADAERRHTLAKRAHDAERANYKELLRPYRETMDAAWEEVAAVLAEIQSGQEQIEFPEARGEE